VKANDQSATLRSVKISMSRYAKGGVGVSSEQAARARADIEKAVADNPSGTPIELDFSGIVATSTTFADDCIGRVLASRLVGYDEDYPLLVVGANPEARTTLAVALRARKLSLLSVSDDGGVELLGADEILSETMDEAVKLESFSVQQLADELGLTVQAANNRLVHLVRLGALSRSRVIPSRGGREFRYDVPLHGTKGRNGARATGRVKQSAA